MALLFVSWHNPLLNRLLAFFMVTVSLVYLLEFYSRQTLAPDFVILIRTFTPLYYFLPAACYLYIRTFIRDDVRLKKRDLWHLLPALLHLIYIFPLTLALIQGRIRWIEIIRGAGSQTYFYNNGPIPDIFHMLFRIGLILFYVILVWVAYRGREFRSFVSKNKDLYPLAIRWISFFVKALTTCAFFAILMKYRAFIDSDDLAPFTGDLVSFCLLISFDILIAFAIFNPIILFGLPHFTRHSGSRQQIAANHPASFGKFKLSAGNSSFALAEKQTPESGKDDNAAPEENEEMKKLIRRMDEHIAATQPFRKPAFNMEQLSRELGVPRHHISFIFRNILKKSFVDFRNELRVNYVIDCMKRSSHKEFTLEAIGMEAGFHSKTSFFTGFKKLTGTTPMQFQKNLKTELTD